MLSSDKNVENIAQLIEVLKHYGELQTEYIKLNVIEKVVRLLTATALAIILFMILTALLLFMWLGVAHWLAAYIGLAGAFFVVAGLHAVVLALFIIFRKSWIEQPLVRFLAGLLLS